jgi:hypothetical protein
MRSTLIPPLFYDYDRFYLGPMGSVVYDVAVEIPCTLSSSVWTVLHCRGA